MWWRNVCAAKTRMGGGGGDLNLVNINRQSKALFLSRLLAFGIVTFGAFAIVATDASAQTPVGVVTGVDGGAAIQRGANSLTPRVGTQLDQGDRLTTGADGHLEGTLSDNSQFELAEASSMALDQVTVGCRRRTHRHAVDAGARSVAYRSELVGRWSTKLRGTHAERGGSGAWYQVEHEVSGEHRTTGISFMQALH